MTISVKEVNNMKEYNLTSFINYAKVRVTSIVGLVCVEYIILSYMYPEKCGRWFN